MALELWAWGDLHPTMVAESVWLKVVSVLLQVVSLLLRMVGVPLWARSHDWVWLVNGDWSHVGLMLLRIWLLESARNFNLLCIEAWVVLVLRFSHGNHSRTEARMQLSRVAAHESQVRSRTRVELGLIAVS